MRCIAEYQAAEAITAVVRGPRYQGRRSTRVHRLEAAASRKMHIGSKVHNDKNGSLALFTK
jgi:hypothetical protein